MTVKDRIEEVISNGATGSFPEYHAIWDDIRKSRKKVNLLIFGVGHDALLWKECNKTGKTLFIENNPKLAKLGKKLGCQVSGTAYNSRKLSKDKIHHPSILALNLGREVENTEWTHIFVDGPKQECHGRIKSIFNASRLAGKNTMVYVSNYDRKSEKLYTDHFLKVKSVVDRLAVCQKRT